MKTLSGTRHSVRNAVALSGLLILIPACVSKSAAAVARPDPAVPVKVGKVVEKDMPVEVAAVGNVEAYDTVSVRALATGQLVRVSFREGDAVKQGDLLFEIDPRPYQAALAQAEATLAKDRAQAHAADVDARRYEELVKGQLVSAEQNDSAQASARALDATVQADLAAVKTARLNLGYCTVRAPISGRTGRVLVQGGNMVQASAQTPLVVIDQLKPIYVTFSVPEQVLPQLHQKRETSTLPVTAKLPGDGPLHSGTLTFVDNTVNTATGTVVLKATFANADEALWPGQFVNVVIAVADRPHAVVAPAAAVQGGQSGSNVFVVKADRTVELRAVEVTSAGATEAIIGKGLSPGETVVTDGQLRLTPGARVAVQGAEEARK